jgi:hypothetical protein
MQGETPLKYEESNAMRVISKISLKLLSEEEKMR